jgi:hypothetical protein
MNPYGERQWLTHIGLRAHQTSLHFFASPGGYFYFAGESRDTLMVNNTPMLGPTWWQERMGALDRNGQLSGTEAPKQNFSDGSNIFLNKRNEGFFTGGARFLNSVLIASAHRTLTSPLALSQRC